MEKGTIFYIVQECGGSYDAIYEHLIGLWETYDDALNQAKKICSDHIIDESSLPMTFDEYINCNSGFPDNPWEFDKEHQYTDDEREYLYNRVDRDGHTVHDFEIMENAFNLSLDEFCFCRINDIVIGDNKDFKKMTVYVSNDKDNKSDFIIKKY